jgi:hypothetical protein
VDFSVAMDYFGTSGLEQPQLDLVMALSSESAPGEGMNEREFGTALKLIFLAQNGLEPDLDVLEAATEPPVIGSLAAGRKETTVNLSMAGSETEEGPSDESARDVDFMTYMSDAWEDWQEEHPGEESEGHPSWLEAERLAQEEFEAVWAKKASSSAAVAKAGLAGSVAAAPAPPAPEPAAELPATQGGGGGGGGGGALTNLERLRLLKKKKAPAPKKQQARPSDDAVTVVATDVDAADAVDTAPGESTRNRLSMWEDKIADDEHPSAPGAAAAATKPEDAEISRLRRKSSLKQKMAMFNQPK